MIKKINISEVEAFFNNNTDTHNSICVCMLAIYGSLFPFQNGDISEGIRGSITEQILRNLSANLFMDLSEVPLPGSMTLGGLSPCLWLLQMG